MSATINYKIIYKNNINKQIYVTYYISNKRIIYKFNIYFIISL